MTFQYLLGDSEPETERLRAQAALWDPVSLALFDRIGVARGWQVLEIGPGAGSLHFELRQRVGAAIDAVEQSPSFYSRLVENCGRDGFGMGRIWNENLLDATLPRDHYDLVFMRWVFLFLPDPLGHLQKLVAAVKPGGIIAIQDYFRDTFCLIPRPADWDAFIAADRAFFAVGGGDINIGARLPQLYREAGLEVIDIHPTIKTGRPGSDVWNWISTYFFGLRDKYATFPPFTPEAAGRLFGAWSEAERYATSLLIAPALLDIVGRRPQA